MNESNYWISTAAETEAKMDQLRFEFEMTKLAYEQKIASLEQLLLQANINAQLSTAENYNDLSK